MISFKSEYSLCDHIGGLCPDKDINRIFEQYGCRIDQKSSQKAKDITNMVEDGTITESGTSAGRSSLFTA